MCRVAQLYGMSVNEALRLTDSQVNFMLEQADLTAKQMLANNPSFQQALANNLAATRRAVRAQLDGSAGDSGSTDGGAIGPPPVF